MKTDKDDNIALFVDAENLIRSALDIGLPIDLAPVTQKLLEYGRLTVRRGFGDLNAACKGDWNMWATMRRMMQDNLIQFEDIPYITKFKNSADMRLAVEAISMAYSHPDVNYFAIVAADRDYVPVIAKLKELGKKIIGIGSTPDTVHEIYVKSCDVFIYYSTLFSMPSQVESIVPEHDSEGLLEDYLTLLVQATSAILQKGKRAYGSLLVPLMRQLRPDFDLKLVKLSSFRELVGLAEERKLVTSTSSGGDLVVQLGSSSQPTISLSIQAPIEYFDPSDVSGAKRLYLDFLEAKMKCPLPSQSTRNKIYESAFRVIETRRVMGGRLNLVEISTETWERIGKEKSGLMQPVAFKLLYSLYRAGAFEAEITDQPYNPTLKAAKVTPEEWDRYFVRNSITIMAHERRAWPLLERALAELFEVPSQLIGEEIDLVNNG